MLSAVTSAQLLQRQPPSSFLLFFLIFFALLEAFSPSLSSSLALSVLVLGVRPCTGKEKKGGGGGCGEGINKNVLAVTRDLSAGNEGP